MGPGTRHIGPCSVAFLSRVSSLGITLNRPYTLTGPAIPLDPRLSTYSSPVLNVPVLFQKIIKRRYDDILPDPVIGGNRFYQPKSSRRTLRKLLQIIHFRAFHF